ncbi:insulin-like growth factor 3.L [Mantella aurantiaca]
MCLGDCRKQKTPKVTRKKAAPLTVSQVMLCLSLVFTLCVGVANARCSRRSKEMLCGSELVDMLQFICGPRGFYVSKSGSVRSKSRPGIVEECCFCGCSFFILESYCALPSTNTTGKEVCREDISALEREQRQATKEIMGIKGFYQEGKVIKIRQRRILNNR